MGVATSSDRVDALSSPTGSPVPAAPVKVVGNAGNQSIGMGIEIVAKHTVKAGTRLRMPNMSDHTVGDERLAPLIKIEPPGVGGSMSNRLDDSLCRVIAPNPTIDR